MATALGGWGPSLVKVEIHDDVLRFRAPRETWGGLVITLFSHPGERTLGGPHLLEVRARAVSEVKGRIMFRSSESTFNEEQTRYFGLPGGQAWSDIALTLPFGEPPIVIRLDIRGAETQVEIDRIQLRALKDEAGSWPAFTSRLDWRFDLVDGH